MVLQRFGIDSEMCPVCGPVSHSGTNPELMESFGILWSMSFKEPPELAPMHMVLYKVSQDYIAMRLEDSFLKPIEHKIDRFIASQF